MSERVFHRVSERIPGGREDCLCYGQRTLLGKTTPMTTWSKYNHNRNGGQWDCEETYCIAGFFPVHTKITHWMSASALVPNKSEI